PDGSGKVAVEAGHDAKERALPSHVRSQDPDLRVWIERKGDPAEDLPLGRGYDFLELIHREDELRGHGKTVTGTLSRVVGGYRRNFRLSKDVRPIRYELHCELECDTWRSTGNERISLRSARPSREITLHSIELEIVGATIDGANRLADVQTDAESE